MVTPLVSADPELGAVYFWREFEEPYGMAPLTTISSIRPTQLTCILGFLSQWYESAFEVDGVTYLTAEMWMMIQKARLFGDEVRSLRIRTRDTIWEFDALMVNVGNCPEDDGDHHSG
jgi:predicted NAD-dependent protein-ADP-ribosyltransferase YbiA (DUF1768 family)